MWNRFVLVLLVLTTPVSARDKSLTLEELYHPTERVDFDGAAPRQRLWSPDGQSYLERDGRRYLKVEGRSGASRVWLDAERLEAGFAALADFAPSAAAAAARNADLEIGADGELALLRWGGDLFLHHVSESRLTRLTSDPGVEELPEPSPGGRLVAFVREADLYVVDHRGSREKRLTFDGGPQRLNGKLDWVYQEEVYGRGNFKGYWWSPDSRHIAFLQLDQARVPRFTVVDHRPPHLELETDYYPKAGDPNPEARLGMVSVADGQVVWADLSAYSGAEILIVRVAWAPDGGSGRVYFQVQDREQTWLDLLSADADTGTVEKVLRESTPAWVNVLGDPRWLGDGTFLWQSERSGFRHLYRYSSEGALLGAVTSGEWEIRGLEAVDEEKGLVYITATRDHPLEQHLYRVRIDGGEIGRVTRRAGHHAVDFSPDGGLYIGTWSDIETPSVVSLHEADGELVRELEAGGTERLSEYRLGRVEFLQFPARDGHPLNAKKILPPDFDPQRRYPVLCYVYGGPQAPAVRNRWGGRTYLWHQMLARKGYIVWVSDNRSSGARGVGDAWPAHRRLGDWELRDLEDGVEWLKSQPYVDGDRIGLWGWSYGGYLTAYAMTRSTLFRVGISGAPVTDWRLYDTIYTERYMGRPQANPEGYRGSSVVESAEGLHGRLLLIHGTMDDNVHLQNTLQLAEALQRAGKQFDLMLYPGSRHGVVDRRRLYHLRTLMTRFILDEL
jgi:dipeptidyl-peptidase 4